MKDTEDESLKRIKRIWISDDFLIFLAQSKIGFKEPKGMKHYTMKFLRDGIVDFHETVECVEEEGKKYPRAERIDLKKFAEALEKEVPSLFKEIDISKTQYSNTNVIIVPPKEELRKKVQVKHREVKIDLGDLDELACSVPMKELSGHDFKVAFFIGDNKRYSLYRFDGRYYSLQNDEVMKLLDKILEKSII